MIAATGHPLFSLAYTKQVFARIETPSKELVVLESNQYPVFNDALDAAVPRSSECSRHHHQPSVKVGERLPCRRPPHRRQSSTTRRRLHSAS